VNDDVIPVKKRNLCRGLCYSILLSGLKTYLIPLVIG